VLNKLRVEHLDHGSRQNTGSHERAVNDTARLKLVELMSAKLGTSCGALGSLDLSRPQPRLAFQGPLVKV
jgi:hypothetical protein